MAARGINDMRFPYFISLLLFCGCANAQFQKNILTTNTDPITTAAILTNNFAGAVTLQNSGNALGGTFTGPGYNMLTSSSGASIFTTLTNAGQGFGVNAAANVWAASGNVSGTADIGAVIVTNNSAFQANISVAGETNTGTLYLSNITAQAASGSNIGGTNLVIGAGLGTGTGQNGALIVKTGRISGTTGSTANTAVWTHFDSPHQVTISANNSAQAMFTFTLGTGHFACIRVYFTGTANNGTDFGEVGHTTYVGAVNKAGTVTAAIASNTGTQSAVSSGSIASTPSATVSGTTVTWLEAVNSSLSSISTEYGMYELDINTDDPNLVITPL